MHNGKYFKVVVLDGLPREIKFEVSLVNTSSFNLNDASICVML